MLSPRPDGPDEFEVQEIRALRVSDDLSNIAGYQVSIDWDSRMHKWEVWDGAIYTSGSGQPVVASFGMLDDAIDYGYAQYDRGEK